jgi:hypothetical protein
MKMAEVLVMEELPVPAEKVWELVRDFGGIEKWLGAMVQGLEVDGEGVGAIRTIMLPGNNQLQEQLTAHSDADRSFSYAIVGKSPLPVEDYLATFELIEAGDQACRIEWSSTFEPAGIAEVDARPMIEGIYTSGIAALRKTLGI